MPSAFRSRRAAARGSGSAVLAGLAQWTADQQVEHLYLQIEEDNPPVRRIHAAAGFATLFGDHYRTTEFGLGP